MSEEDYDIENVVAAAVAAERAEIARWLRSNPAGIPSYQRCLAMAADAIERGEHRT